MVSTSSKQQLLKQAEKLAKTDKTKALELLKQIESDMQEANNNESDDDDVEQEEVQTEKMNDAEAESSGDEEDEEIDDDKLFSMLQAPSKNQSLSESFASRDNAEQGERQRRQRSVVCIWNLPEGFEEEEIREFMNQISKVIGIRVLRSKKTGRSRGVAFVKFEDEEIAEMICREFDYYLVEDKVLRVQMSKIPVRYYKWLFNKKLSRGLRHKAKQDYKSIKQNKNILKEATKVVSEEKLKKTIKKEQISMIKKQQKWSKKGIEISSDFLEAVVKQSTQPVSAPAPATPAAKKQQSAPASAAKKKETQQKQTPAKKQTATKKSNKKQSKK